MLYVVVHKSLIFQKDANIFKVIKILSAHCILFFLPFDLVNFHAQTELENINRTYCQF